jgi:PTS system galactitol-specific IIA component
MADLIISPDLIEIALDVADKEQAISVLSQKLLERDLVDEGFTEHLIDREKNYPTGLPTPIPIALCHTEAQYVNQSALAIATLEHPIVFQEMGTPENELAVEMILVLALKDPKDQVPTLRRIVTTFKDIDVSTKIRNASSSDMLSDYLRQLLANKQIVNEGGSRGNTSS